MSSGCEAKRLSRDLSLDDQTLKTNKQKNEIKNKKRKDKLKIYYETLSFNASMSALAIIVKQNPPTFSRIFSP